MCFFLLHVEILRGKAMMKEMCEFWYLTVRDLSKHYANEHAKCKSINFPHPLKPLLLLQKERNENSFENEAILRMRGEVNQTCELINICLFLLNQSQTHDMHSHHMTHSLGVDKNELIDYHIYPHRHHSFMTIFD